MSCCKRCSYFFIITFIAILFNFGCSSSGGKGSSAPSSTAIPLPPANLTVSQNTNGVVLSWNASSGATSYKVYQSTKSGGQYTNIASSTITTYTVTGLSSGTVYYFVVTALNSKGESGYSNEASILFSTQHVSASSAPTNLKTAVSGTQATLTWTGVSGAQSYTVYYSLIAGGPYMTVDSTSNTNYTIKSLQTGTTYYFVVTAVNNGGESGYSNEASAVITLPKPLAPTSLSANPADSMISLTWQASSYATSYNVYESTTSGGPYSKIASSQTPNYTATSLSNSTIYYFVVTAVNSTGESGYSNEASAVPFASTTTPSAPTNLSATAGNKQATLSWNAVNGATSYNIYYSTISGGSYTKIGASNNTSTDISSLTDGTTYYFVVSAVNSAGESTYSNQASATPIGVASAPAGLTASAGDKEVTLSWSAVSGATSYNIYYSTTSGGAYTKIGSGAATSGTVNGLTNGTAYYFVVTAVNSIGESVYSSQASSTPVSAVSVPLAPTNFTAIGGNTQIAISFSSVTGATSYNVYWSFTSGGPYKLLGGLTITSTNLTDAQNGTTYYLVVTAVNSVGESGYSNEASATPAYQIKSFSAGNGANGIAIDSQGNVYVSNYIDNTVSAFNNTGTTIATYPMSTSPQGLAVDAAGNLWVAINGWAGIAIDMGGDAWVTNQNNDTVIEWNAAHVTEGTFNVGRVPAGIAIDASGNVWVTNNMGGTVSEMTSSGNLIGSYPAGTNPDGIAIDAYRHAWVANTGDNDVVELNGSGQVVGTYQLANGAHPTGIAIDASGNVWVVDWGIDSVTKLDSNGNILGTFPVGHYPVSIAIDSAGNVWVVNAGSASVSKIIGITKGPQYWPYSGPEFPGGGN